MKVYIASSWRCVDHPKVLRALRDAGHDAYDFRGANSFDWHNVASQEQLSDPRRFRDEVLNHPQVRASFASDMGALRAAAATVLVLPCGPSAHLELGWAARQGQRTIILLDDPLSEPELMYLMNTKICVSVDEVVESLATEQCPHCVKEEGEVNHPDGMIFVGWGHGWQPCIHCKGSALVFRNP